jgi:hypothetical protein
MDQFDPPEKKPLSYYLGYCICIAGGAKLMSLLLISRAASPLPALQSMLFGLVVPSALCALLGGLGLMWGRMFGYYLVYASLFFSALGGRVSFVPLLDIIVRIPLHTEDIVLAANIIIVLVLAWEHWHEIELELDPPKEKLLRLSLIASLLLAFAAQTYTRSGIHKQHGTASSITELPLIGQSLAPLETKGPIEFYSVHLRAGFLTLVTSGATTEHAIEALADKHNLKPMKPETQRKFLPQVRQWRLDPARFPTDFPADSLRYVGRFADHPKLILEICYRKSDNRFTAQVMGAL